MKKNKLKVLSLLALSGLAIGGLAACKVDVENPTTTPAVTTPAAPSQTTTTTPSTSTTTVVPSTSVNKIDLVEVSGVKESYIIGETLSLDGVEVTKYYTSGDSEVVPAGQYTAKLYSDEACTTEVANNTFATVGEYYLKFVVEEKSKVVKITVTEKQYVVKQLFDASDLQPNDNIINDIKLYEKEGFTITALVASGKEMKVNANEYPGSSSSAVVGDYKFTQRLQLRGSALGSGATALTVDDNGEVTNNRVLKIVVPKATTIKIVARHTTDGEVRKLALTDNKNVNEEFDITKEANMETTSANVEAGTYYVYSKSKGIDIYGIEFSYSVNESSLEYSEIKAETTKAEFNVGTAYTTEGLTVKGLNQYGVWDTLTDYTVKNDQGGDVVLNKPGKHTLTVSAANKTTTYEISVIATDSKTATLTVKTPASDTVYKQGEEIDFDDLVIKAVDQYSVATDVNVKEGLAAATPTVSYKVYQGETDVTANWATLAAGKYSVKLTYDDATVTYEVVIVTKSGADFDIPEVLAIGSTVFSSSVTIKYSDGTDEYAKEAVKVPSTTDGYTTSYYSDAAGTTATTLEAAAAQAGTVYVKASYDGYTSNLITVTVKNVSSDSAMVKDLIDAVDAEHPQADFKGKVLHDGSLIKVEVGPGSAKNENDVNIAEGVTTIKLDEVKGENPDPTEKSIKITAKSNVTLKIILNASGSSKAYKVVDSQGVVKASGNAAKGAENTVVEVTIAAGETYVVYAPAGGVRFVGVEAVKSAE